MRRAVHTGIDIKNLTLNYQVENTTWIQTTEFVFTALDFLEETGQRNTFSFLLQDLQPRSNCSVEILYPNGTVFGGPYWYLVPPDRLGEDEEFVMMTGGDMGTSEMAKTVIQMTMSHNPSVFVIGGDLMYDNNIKPCYLPTDNFLDILSGSVHQVFPNRLVPLVLVLGNHDIGLNPLSSIQVELTPEKAPYFYTFFPQHFPRSPENGSIIQSVPALNQRVPFFYHEMAGVMHLSLDSGYIYNFSGVQYDYMQNAFQRSADHKTLRMVAYHVPAYPSCGLEKGYRPQGTIDAYLYWLPLFDQFRVMIAYENHVHEMKRTYPIAGNGKAASKNATTYLGDGAIGVSIDECQFGANIPDLFAYVSSENHAWITRVSNQSTFVEGVAANGTILDSVLIHHQYFYESNVFHS